MTEAVTACHGGCNPVPGPEGRRRSGSGITLTCSRTSPARRSTNTTGESARLDAQQPRHRRALAEAGACSGHSLPRSWVALSGTAAPPERGASPHPEPAVPALRRRGQVWGRGSAKLWHLEHCGARGSFTHGGRAWHICTVAASITYGCSLDYIRLQPRSHTVTASIT